MELLAEAVFITHKGNAGVPSLGLRCLSPTKPATDTSGDCVWPHDGEGWKDHPPPPYAMSCNVLRVCEIPQLCILDQVLVRGGAVSFVQFFSQRVAARNNGFPVAVHEVPQVQRIGVVEIRASVPHLVVSAPGWVWYGVETLGIEEGDVLAAVVLSAFEIREIADGFEHPCH